MIDFHAGTIRTQLINDLGIALSMPVHGGRPRIVAELPVAFVAFTSYKQSVDANNAVVDIRQEYEFTIWWSRVVPGGSDPNVLQEVDSERIVQIITSDVPYAGVAQEFNIESIDYDLNTEQTEPVIVCQAVIRFWVDEKIL